LTVLPASNCALELPEGAPGAIIWGVVPPEPPLEPQAVNPRIANAIASAPAVTLRDLEVVCIFFFLSGVLDRVEDFIALASGEGRIRRIFLFFY
jgi:hypothetical protein